VQEVVKFLLNHFKDRFSLYEHALVNKIIIKKTGVLIDVGDYTVSGEKVVLCTNGFDRFTIIAPTGLDVNTRFHHDVKGTIGYMSGYLEKMNKPPISISYFTDPDSSSTDPYFYLTRRLFKDGKNKYNLISIGGPETPVIDRLRYARDMLYPEAVVEEIDKFVKKVYDKDPNRKVDYKFTWHGLMGYTKNNLRMIGPDPEYDVLLYNLGCNGVGILPSLYGASRVAEFIAERKVKPSIFDVNSRE
jgi:glycine/D-amino acid oxidase-like deaminating enzyme